jgi:hypothetical protein
VHAPCEDKGDDVKDSFYVELECVFDQFPRYNMKIILGDFKAKVGNFINTHGPLLRETHTKRLITFY